MLAFGIIPIENTATKHLGEKCHSSIQALFGVVCRLEHCVNSSCFRHVKRAHAASRTDFTCVNSQYNLPVHILISVCVCLTGSLAQSSQRYSYTASDMAIATVLCIVVSLVLGTVAGYRVSLWRHPRDDCAHLKQPTICTNQLEIKASNSQISHYSPMPKAKHTNVFLDTKQNGLPCTKLDNNSRQEYV